MKDKTKNPYYNAKIQKILNKLISEEWVAGNMYKSFVLASDGDVRGFLAEKFMEISHDELDEHMESMVDWALTYGYDVPLCVKDYHKYADEKCVRIAESVKRDQDIDYYLKKSAESEELAIQSYMEVLQESDLLQEFGDLHGIIMRNYYDEVQHMEDIGVMSYTNSITVEV